MAQDLSAPATKEDVKLLLEHFAKNNERLYVLELQMDTLENKMERDKEEIKRHFDVVAENIKHDFLHGAIPDKVQQHEDRIVRLERKTFGKKY